MSIKAKYPPLPIAETVEIGCEKFSAAALPDGFRVMEDVGLVCPETMTGTVVYRAAKEMYEVRATITPGGDVLNIFVSHLWRQAVHLQIKEADLLKLPAKSEMLK